MFAFSTLAAVFAVLFLIGCALVVRAQAFARRAVRVRARVVSRTPRPLHRKELLRTWMIVVEIRDASGAMRQVPLAESLGGPTMDRLMQPDGTIAVLYNPARPETVRADSPFIVYLIAAYFCVPGLLFALFCAWVWLVY